MFIVLKLKNRFIKNGEVFYSFANEDSTIYRDYSHSFMTKWVDYPLSMLDSNGYLRDGVFVQFYIKQDAMGRILYVPDQSKYWAKQSIENKLKLDTETPSKIDYSDKPEFSISILSSRSKELIRSALNRINEFDNSEKEQLASFFSFNDISSACNLIIKVLQIPAIPEENQEIEYKEGVDFREIAQELLGFANSRTEGILICGIRDKTREIIGVEQLLERKGFTIEQCKTGLLNSISQVIANADFLRSLTIDWYQYEGHLLMAVSIPRWNGDYLFFSGKDLFMRKDAMNKNLSAAEVLTLKHH
jgi:hypothetical protein